MASNCEDCFDRAVTIPVGPTGATGATGATGPAGANGNDGADGITVLIDEFEFRTNDSNSYVSLMSGTIPANSLDKVGDALRLEFAAYGLLTDASPATYDFRFTLGGVTVPYTYTTDSTVSLLNNSIFGTVDLVVMNLSPFTIRVHIKELDKMGAGSSGTLFLASGSSGSPFRYTGMDTTSDMVGLITRTVNNTLVLQGKNSTGSAQNTFGAVRLSVKLLKHV